MTDREKIIKGLDTFVGLCSDKWSPHRIDRSWEELQHLLADALSMLKEQEMDIEALKKSYNELAEKGEPVVRCKDCKHKPYCLKYGWRNDEWFCADGVAKDINVPNKEGR